MGAAAKNAEQVKVRNSAARLAADGIDFLPFAMEVFCGISETSIPFLNKLGQAYSDSSTLPLARSSHFIATAISFACARSVANQLMARYSPIIPKT